MIYSHSSILVTLFLRVILIHYEWCLDIPNLTYVYLTSYAFSYKNNVTIVGGTHILLLSRIDIGALQSYINWVQSLYYNWKQYVASPFGILPSIVVWKGVFPPIVILVTSQLVWLANRSFLLSWKHSHTSITVNLRVVTLACLLNTLDWLCITMSQWTRDTTHNEALFMMLPQIIWIAIH